MACDLAECCDDAVRGAGADAGAIAALLGEFASVSGVLEGGTCGRAVVGATGERGDVAGEGTRRGARHIARDTEGESVRE
jgi:hypothetical protein